MEFIELSACARPLLDKFYKSQRSRMRSVGGGRWWVARDREIVAGSSFVAVDEGYWLSGLHVAIGYRNKGHARRLLDSAQAVLASPVWLFCEPGLREFYRRAGFIDAPSLPAELAQRLTRYQASKDLLAMVRTAPGRACEPAGTVTSHNA